MIRLHKEKKIAFRVLELLESKDLTVVEVRDILQLVADMTLWTGFNIYNSKGFRQLRTQVGAEEKLCREIESLKKTTLQLSNEKKINDFAQATLDRLRSRKLTGNSIVAILNQAKNRIIQEEVKP